MLAVRIGWAYALRMVQQQPRHGRIETACNDHVGEGQPHGRLPLFVFGSQLTQ